MLAAHSKTGATMQGEADCELAPSGPRDVYILFRGSFGATMPVSLLRPRRVRSRRREASRHRARSKDRSWEYLRHEFHVGASRGSGDSTEEPGLLR
jgi:hypothetical protein